MTRDEAEAVIREKEGRLCGRVYRRRDSRVLTADCPVGVGRRRSRLARQCGLLFATVLLSVCSRIAARPEEQPLQSRSWLFAKIDELVYQAKVKLGLVQLPSFQGKVVTMGRICFPPPAAATAPDSQAPTASSHQ